MDDEIPKIRGEIQKKILWNTQHLATPNGIHFEDVLELECPIFSWGSKI